MYFALKVAISAVLIAVISELAKRHAWLASILASLPLTSILAMLWLYRDTKDISKVSALSYGVFWMVAPSLLFFLILPPLLRHLPFAAAMLFGCALMAGAYYFYVPLLAKLGIKI